MAELQGNSALSGGAGAVAGEVAADIIRKQLYGKEVKDLTEEEKQTISALSQLAAGLAVAAGGGSVYGDYIAFRDADSWGDYAIATAGVLPFAKYIKVAGKVVKVETKAAQTLVKDAEAAIQGR